MGKNRDLIAFCGLYCGDCPGYKGEIADLARDLRKKLREEKFDFLKPVHEDAHLKNLRKIKKQGIDKFIEGKR